MAKRKTEKPKKTPKPPASRQYPRQVQPKRSGGDGAGSQVQPSEEKSIGKKLALWLGIVTAILAIATFVLDLPGKLQQFWQPVRARYYGKVVDAADSGVGGADIFVLEKAGGDTIGLGKTLPNGDFNFIVKAKRESSAFVRVIKDNRVGFSEYKVLAAGDKILFRLPANVN